MNTGFQDRLDATEIGESCGRSVWRLNQPLIFVLNTCVTIVAPVDFETDLASVPRLPIVYDAWGDRAHRPAVIHDFMYRIDARTVQGKEIAKEDADWYFRQAMVATGVSWFTYQPMYWGVRSAGGSSFHRMLVMDHFPLDVKE